MKKNITLIGAGFTSIGASNRLYEENITDFKIFEKNNHIGGLASSFIDEKNFTWDIGGHVIFSHYKKFNEYLNDALNNKYYLHERRSYVRILNKFIPYPFQNNIAFLPKEKIIECINGLIDSIGKEKNSYLNFLEFINCVFGKGIADIFMIPYNLKVWKTPLKKMSAEWIAERVSQIDIKRVLKNTILKKIDASWGPNNKFLFPKNGGTGKLFEKAQKKFSKNINYNKKLFKISFKNKKLFFSDNSSYIYDILINTMPISKLITISDAPDKLKNMVNDLEVTSGYMIGIGLKGKITHKKCWLYFPESNCPFYRVTYFSNYARSNAPKNHFSLLCETSYSKYMNYSKEKIINDTIEGLINTEIIKKHQEKDIVSKWIYNIPYSYPVPSIKRNKVLKEFHKFLEKNDVFSRGRFGAYLYEVGNMDHSFMQGYEVINKILNNEKETVFSLDNLK